MNVHLNRGNLDYACGVSPPAVHSDRSENQGHRAGARVFLQRAGKHGSGTLLSAVPRVGVT